MKAFWSRESAVYAHVALAIDYQRLQVRTNPEISQSPVLRRFKRNVAMRKFLPIAYLLTLLTGCATSTQVGNTARSSIEERLLISSFEQALATLDTHEFKGKTVTVDFYGLGFCKGVLHGLARRATGTN